MNPPEQGAPEHDQPEIGGLPPHPPCTFCQERDTELVSAFGAHASVATYWCRSCRSPFDLLKWGGGGR